MAEGRVQWVGGEEGGGPDGRGRSRGEEGVEGDEDSKGGLLLTRNARGCPVAKTTPPTHL